MIERVSDGTPTAFTCGNCGYWWEHEPLDGEAVRAGAASHPHGAVAARWHLGLKDDS